MRIADCFHAKLYDCPNSVWTQRRSYYETLCVVLFVRFLYTGTDLPQKELCLLPASGVALQLEPQES